jgi:Uncharacterised nucleotidyltransferase
MDLLQTHIASALCQAAFRRVRTTERQRAWTLQALVQFWTAVIFRAPEALSQALDRLKLFWRDRVSSPTWRRSPTRPARPSSPMRAEMSTPVIPAGGRGGYWPNEEKELLLRAALLVGADAVEAWRLLRPRLHVDDLDRSSRRLLPLLGANLRRLGIDDSMLASFDAARSQTAAENRGLFDATRRLLLALRNAGIETLVLKGAALAVAYYRDPGLRPMTDVDVLVPPARAEAAVDVLRSAGWAPKTIGVTPASLEVQHARPFVDVDGRQCDLHWHTYWEDCRPGADDELWAASIRLDFEGTPTRMLGPADQLLHLCVHGSRPVRWPPLLWIPDVLLLLRAGGVDWPRLVTQAARRGFALRTRAMLGYLSNALAAPIPADALARLQAVPISRGERLEFYAGNHRQGLLGELPSYWAKYRRSRPGTGHGSPLAFVRFLQQVWEMESLAQVAGGVLARTRKRLRITLRG